MSPRPAIGGGRPPGFSGRAVTKPIGATYPLAGLKPFFSCCLGDYGGLTRWCSQTHPRPWLPPGKPSPRTRKVAPTRRSLRRVGTCHQHLLWDAGVPMTDLATLLSWGKDRVKQSVTHCSKAHARSRANECPDPLAGMGRAGPGAPHRRGVSMTDPAIARSCREPSP